MCKKFKDKSEFQEENPLENEDNCFLYEPPKLRKHGKVSNATQLTPIPVFSFDANIGFPYSDVS
jgi:hypothetical protein